jgi:hypothetical protein
MTVHAEADKEIEALRVSKKKEFLHCFSSDQLSTSVARIA